MAEDNTTEAPSKSRSTRSTSSTRSTRTSTTAKTTTTTAPPRAKRVSAQKKIEKTWAEKVVEKNKKLDKLLVGTRKFGGALSDGTIKEIKKRVSLKGPTAVSSMHFLGTVRQRKELARDLQSILDA
jgi:hypothetical protein